MPDEFEFDEQQYQSNPKYCEEMDDKFAAEFTRQMQAIPGTTHKQFESLLNHTAAWLNFKCESVALTIGDREHVVIARTLKALQQKELVGPLEVILRLELELFRPEFRENLGTGHPVSETERQIVCKLYDGGQGLTLSSLSRIFQRSKSTISELISKPVEAA